MIFKLLSTITTHYTCIEFYLVKTLVVVALVVDAVVVVDGVVVISAVVTGCLTQHFKATR